MTLEETLQKVSYRQYLVYMAWFDMEYNHPSRSDYYQMQTSLEIRRLYNKGLSVAEEPTLKTMELKAETPIPVRISVKLKQMIANSKARLALLTGRKGK